MNSESVNVPESLCPYCAYHFEMATNVTGQGLPHAGAVTLCIRCGEILVFTEHLLVRKPTPMETEQFARSPRIEEVKRAWRTVKNELT